jgi:hypothetical protein
MTMEGRRNWRKSSYSGGGNNSCVEVAFEVRAVDVVGVRDSKNTTGPRLAFAASAWHRFLSDAPTDFQWSAAAR